MAVVSPSITPLAGDGRLGTLRGATVAVDHGRLVRLLTVMVLVALALGAVASLAYGVHGNAQRSDLRSHGVPVTVTVTSCLGELGGSGSNPVDYVCRGSYDLAGQRYSSPVPGTTAYAPGTQLHAVAVPGALALASSTGAVLIPDPSWHVYVLPAVLAGGFVAIAVLARRAGRRRAASEPRKPLA
jgi:hypothetical protein